MLQRIKMRDKQKRKLRDFFLIAEVDSEDIKALLKKVEIFLIVSKHHLTNRSKSFQDISMQRKKKLLLKRLLNRILYEIYLQKQTLMP